MLDDEPTTTPGDGVAAAPAAAKAAKKTAKKAVARPAKKAAGAATLAPTAAAAAEGAAEAPVKRTRKKAAAAAPTDSAGLEPGAAAEPAAAEPKPARKRASKKAAAAEPAAEASLQEPPAEPKRPARKAALVVPTFQAPEPAAAPPARRTRTRKAAEPELAAELDELPAAPAGEADPEPAADGGDGPRKRSRSRRGRGGRGGAGGQGRAEADQAEAGSEPTDEAEGGEDGDAFETVTNADGTTTRRRRRRRRRRGGGGGGEDEPTTEDGVEVVVHVREPRQRKSRASAADSDDEVRGVAGSTRLEARKQRRREGREQGRRRVPIITESEFLARRESVERVMVVRQTAERTQVAVLEDGILVEHYVSKAAATSYVGNVYLGRVQNVLPSMEAAFVDVGKGRNAVLYAGEVNWDAAGLEGQPRRIESALKPGQPVLVQVTKDPIGHKGARLTSQVSLPGRFVALVPDGTMTGISRKLPENERARLKAILKAVVPEGTGVIVRTAAEGASEEELTRDIKRLSAQWADIQAKAETGEAPALLYAEPDLTVRVIRDVFNEDFSQLVVQGADEWDTVEAYLGHVAPDLVERLSKWTSSTDVFAEMRIDEQLMKGLDRKVWLPSGGSLVIDRTEAMTVVDVNTGKFVGQGGNLEETVTRNNLEAAEEVVRQLRLRDIGGIIVIDFIDMVLESNRDLVLRRLVECLGRDRTKHQVAEVTSLGLVQMTRKRVGQGLLESFSETCDCCNGRGVKIHLEGPPPRSKAAEDRPERGERRGGRRGKGDKGGEASESKPKPQPPSPEAKAKLEAEGQLAPTPGPAEPTAPVAADESAAPAPASAAAPAEPVAAPAEPAAAPARKRRRAVKLSPVDAQAAESAVPADPGSA